MGDPVMGGMVLGAQLDDPISWFGTLDEDSSYRLPMALLLEEVSGGL